MTIIKKTVQEIGCGTNSQRRLIWTALVRHSTAIIHRTAQAIGNSIHLWIALRFDHELGFQIRGDFLNSQARIIALEFDSWYQLAECSY